MSKKPYSNIPLKKEVAKSHRSLIAYGKNTSRKSYPKKETTNKLLNVTSMIFLDANAASMIKNSFVRPTIFSKRCQILAEYFLLKIS